MIKIVIFANVYWTKAFNYDINNERHDSKGKIVAFSTQKSVDYTVRVL